MLKGQRSFLDKILICSIIPYFLEREGFWFQQNLNKILEARKTQSFFEENTIFLEKNQIYNFSQLLRKLDEMGYEKVLEVSEIGEFSHRGGIIDVFPINLNFAIRLEFFGNKIECLEKLPITIEDEKKAKEILKKQLKSQKLFSDLKGLKPGDYLVHLDHGIARFSRIEKSQFPISNFKTNSKFQTQDYYVLEYAQGDKLYVPVGLERKLSRYIGFSEPKISRLGSLFWQRTKRKIKEETEKLAKELLEIYAKRVVTTRSPYLPDDEIDIQLASSFPYEETPDQIEAIEEIKKDLEKEKPMDILLCGDVGFGKTEVALRAMIKVVKSGYQTAMISPTTILANQHFQNFKNRLKNLPIKVGMLSRLQSKKEQKRIIKDLKKGKIDILIGTHRLLSRDVEFKKLGLLVIDDEQRFGVRQKEKLKKMRASLDVLSLSATPIPRTLYLSLSSLRDISLIQTPPVGRLPVKTFILPFNEKIIKNAIENEISRRGQVYYLHNRVETIEVAKNLIQKLVPRIRIGVAHGRLKEKELVKVMEDFGSYSHGHIHIPRGQAERNQWLGYSHTKIDVLVATTIIENGLDLPNVNTLIVADATRLGLAEAYQIRGRIGRSHIQSFAYFLYGSHLTEKVYPVRSQRLSNGAKMRLDALKEAEELGSGYKIALKDLEMRGAGNILGKEQSGNVNKVGLNLYCQMLFEAIEKLKMS
jgi:transcription-repair coupling factor (superfamily II helicase)